MLILALTLVGVTSAFADNRCLPGNQTLDFKSSNGVLNLNGERFNLKAASWFGFETSNYVVHGLWANDYHFYLQFLANNSFNGMRLPFSCDMVTKDPMPNSINFYQMNTDLQGKTSLQVMDSIIAAAGDLGLLVMLDMHSLEADAMLENGLWYDNTYSQGDTLAVWQTMVNRYKNTWNVIAMDVFNEPFDATWGVGDVNTDFNTWCETVGNMAHTSGANWLVMAEGTASSPTCVDNCFYGEDLIGVAATPVELDTPDKVVYCPHVYGPHVYDQSYFQVSTFPANMPAIWNTHFGYIRSLNQSATTIGEWGGVMTGDDLTWMNSFVAYLKDNDTPDQWFWCLNPDSGDTGGLLLDDWVTPDQAKLDLLVTLMPQPSVVTGVC